MKISTKDWLNFINKLSMLDKTASQKVQAYVAQHGFDDDGLLNYAFAIGTKYSEASAALAAQWYDTVAELSKMVLPPAEVAPTPRYDEVAKAVNGTKKYRNAQLVGNSIGRLVKRTGVDTTMKNALRDKAQWAWIPSGDTCAFCITLASRGWQNASKAAMKGDHASHIHANCDCTYAIRFDGETKYSGYDSDKYFEMYENAEGNTSKEKINSLRRTTEASKRENYAEKKLINNRSRGTDVTKEYFEDSTPRRGFVEYETGLNKEKSEEEIKTAKIIFEQLGGDITLKAEKKGQKNPDYMWLDSLWDLKSTTTEKAANSAIKSGMKQIRTNPGGIILNFNNNDFSMDKLINVIDMRMHWYPEDSADIIIISRGEIKKILRY